MTSHRERRGTTESIAPEPFRAIRDLQHRDLAGAIERANPHWYVEWSLFWRCFYAHPRFGTPYAVRAAGANEKDLTAHMREIEKEVTEWQAPGQWGPAAGRVCIADPAATNLDGPRAGQDQPYNKGSGRYGPRRNEI